MKTEKAIFAAGCFWGVEELFRDVPGIVETEVGYCGDSSDKANYPSVKTGRTNHAEAILLTFDPEKISYETCVQKFFQLHDPTTKNQQGNDVGPQYRSAIFYFDAKQKEVAERVIQSLDESKKFKAPIVTEVSPAGEFFSAEDYHQDYLKKNPDGYMCHFWRE